MAWTVATAVWMQATRGCASFPAVEGALAIFGSPRARNAVRLAAALLMLVRLGAADLMPPDEPRYALVAEELRAHPAGARSLVLLTLHGQPYTQKPPLFYWLAAAAGAPGGRVTPWAARLPSALAGLATVELAMRMGDLLAGPAAGTLAGLLLATTVDWSVTARTVQLDTLLAAFETLALLAFLRIERGGRRRRDVLVLHAALGLAVLTKGPVGWIVPILAIAGTLAWERRMGMLRSLLPLRGLALSIGPGLAWLAVAVALGPAGFFRAAVVQNLAGRVLSGTAHAQPFLYYFEKFGSHLLPWLVALPLAVVAASRALRGDADPRRRFAFRFLLAWIGTSVLFFSLVSGKRPRYLLPVEPAVALLLALSFAPWIARRGARAGARLAMLAAVLAGGELVAYTAVLPALAARHSPRRLAEAVVALDRGGPVGLYRAADIADAVAYYGRREVVNYLDPDAFAGFAAHGGAPLVFEAKQLPDVEARVPVAIRGRYRIGAQEWLVAIPDGPAS